MADPWPTPTPRDELLARVVARGRHLVLVRRVLLGVAAAAVVASGAVGVALGSADHDEGSLPPVRRAVALHECPAERAVGELLSGDRVFLTGRTPDGTWLELRDPFDPGGRRWIAAAAVDGDRAAEALPEVDGCGEVLELALDDVAPEPTDEAVDPDDGDDVENGEENGEGNGEGELVLPEPDPDPTGPGQPVPAPTTSQPGPQPGPGPTTTTSPGPTTAPTTTTTSTTQPPLTNPSFGPVSRSAATIRESFNGACDTSLPTSSTVSGSVTHPSGITSVQVRRRIGAGAWGSWQTIATQAGPFTFPIGPYDPDTIPPHSTQAVSFELRATSGHGTTAVRSSTANESVDLVWCSLA